jgi:ferredoxin
MSYRVTVDRDLCIACGVAPAVCPEVFVLGEDNGKNRLLEEHSEKTSEECSMGSVAEDLYDCVKKAADACPVQAITVEEK